MLGRTYPAFDADRCHSGCTPPASLEWRDANLGALLIGYGTEQEVGGGAAVDYWILQLPWGQRWGEGGYVRVLRSDDSIADATIIEPMV